MGKSIKPRVRSKAVGSVAGNPPNSSLAGPAAPTPPIPPVTQVESPPAAIIALAPAQALSKGVERWRRAHDSKSRKKVAKILTLKMAGYKTSAIAERLKTTPENIRHYVYIAGKNGWLAGSGVDLVDPAETLAFETSHKVVRNINRTLDGAVYSPQTHEMTIEVAKGLGLLKTHQVVKNEGQAQAPILQMRIVNVQMVPGQDALSLPEDTVGGQASYIDGQVAPLTLAPGEGQ